MKLLIVESPNKAKSIQKYLGDGWTVAASVGHIRDLPVNEMGLSPPEFQLKYVLNEGASSTVAKLRKLAADASHVYLATDPDREGEAIAWHVKDELGLSDDACSRVTFNVIDAATVRAAVERPRKIDMPLVAAQEARRALDRLVGYSVSPAISNQLGANLSAGRVQTPAVRLVVENERAIAAFKATRHFGAVVDFDGWKAAWETKGHGNDDGFVMDQALAAKAASCRSFTVVTSAQRTVSDGPPPPFNTSSLLQAASVALKFDPDKTMRVAQALFEGHPGAISYHRTDALNLDPATAVTVLAYLASEGLPAAPAHRKFKEKADAQLGHEAIRPADILVREAGTSADEKALYALIWKRAVASQMADATYAETTLALVANDGAAGFRFAAKGRVAIELGWRRLTAADAADEVEPPEDGDVAGGRVPALAEGSNVDATGGKVVNKATRPPPRFTLASLVKRLESLGIGRPATYASIMKNIVARSYIADVDRKLSATKLGMVLIDTLVALDFAFIEYAYTRDLEKSLDDVAEGKTEYVALVRAEHASLERDIAKARSSTAVKPLHPCPKCQRAMRRRQSKPKAFYWLCSGYPDDCKHAMDDKGGEPVERASHPCPDCKRPMYRRDGKSGYFWGCSGYSEGCTATLPDAAGKPGTRVEVSAHPCPECGKGLIHRTRKGRGKVKGYDFWGCSGFPACDYKCNSDARGKPEGVKRAS